MVERFEEQIAAGKMRIENENTNDKGLISYCQHETFDKQQEEILFDVSAIAETELVPTYNFSRKYTKGSILRRHSDRPACEYSVTFCFGVDQKPWSFYCEVEGKTIKVDLNPGDGLYYRGMLVPHWREELDTDYCYQTFFHYVNRHGPHYGQCMEGVKRLRDTGIYDNNDEIFEI